MRTGGPTVGGGAPSDVELVQPLVPIEFMPQEVSKVLSLSGCSGAPSYSSCTKVLQAIRLHQGAQVLQ
jgi:hypothetical protein